MTELSKRQVFLLPKENSVQELLTIPYSTDNQSNSNETELLSFGSWKESDTSALCLPPTNSHSSLSQTSNQSLSSKSGSQIHSTTGRPNSTALRPKSCSYSANKPQSSGIKSVVRGYIEMEPIPFKFEHHDVTMVTLHMDKYRKVYTYPNMEKSMENHSLMAGASSATRTVYSPALVRPKLFVFREGKDPPRVNRHNPVKQFYRNPSPQQSSCELALAEGTPFTSCSDLITQSSSSSTESSSRSCDPPRRPYSTLRTQYRTSLLESSAIKDKDAQYRYSAVPLAQPIATTDNEAPTKVGISNKDRTFSSKSSNSRGGVLGSMTWVPERSSSSPLVITPVKTPSLLLGLRTATPPPTKEKRKPSNNVAGGRDSKLYIDTRTAASKIKQQSKSRIQANRTQGAYLFKTPNKRSLTSPGIPLLANKATHLTAKSASKSSGQTLLLGHRYQVNFRSKQPAFRYETLCLQGNVNGHGSSGPISITSGPWIAQN